MTNKLRTPVRSQIIPEKVRKLLQRIKRRVSTGDEDQDSLLASTLASIRKFFLNLKTKSSEQLEILPDEVRDPVEFNEHIEDIFNDLDVLFKDGDEIAKALPASINYQLTNTRNLESRINRLASQAVDLRLISDTPDNSILVAGDDFSDDSKTDKNFPVPGTRTSPRPVQNSLSLSPTASVNALEGANVIRVEGPARTGKSTGLYEGKLFTWLGEAIPEGGKGFTWLRFLKLPAGNAAAAQKHGALIRKWNNFVAAQFGIDTEDATASGTFVSPPTDLGTLIEDLRSDPSFESGAQTFGTGFGFTLAELELIAGAYHDEIGSDYIVLPYETFADGEIPNQAETVYRPASLPTSVLTVWRNRAIDGDPDSFLRMENTLDVTPGFGLAAEWPPEDWTAFEKVLRSMLSSEQLLEQLQKYANPSEADFQVRVTVELPEPVTANWMNLIPLTELAGAWLRVEDIEFALEDSDEAYERLPGLHANKYDNVLTDESNREISEDEALVTLSPDRQSYVGQGVWIFPARSAKFIRITLRQDVLTPAPYEVLVLKLQNRITITKTITKSGFLGIGSSTKTERETRIIERVVPLSYERSLIMTHTHADGLKKEVATETDAAVPIEFNETTANLLGIDTGIKVGTVVGDILGFLFGSTSVDTSISKGGWQVAEQWTEARFDKARYMVGIRELGAYSYEYAPESAFVSKPFRSPRPIGKVSLFVDEFIPQEFINENPRTPWIAYEVSFDDRNWYRIAPISNVVSLNQDGEPIPQIININSDLPQRSRNPREAFLDLANEVTQVRLRVTMKRPGDLVEFSPVLRSYRMKLALKGGLF